MDLTMLSKVPLFRDISEKDLEILLNCLSPYVKSYKKNEVILCVGDTVDSIGIVLNGSINIENYDIMGNKNIFNRICKGDIFGETYASIPNEPLLIDAVAAEDSEILFVNLNRTATICSNSCNFHNVLVKNLLAITAYKNLMLSRKIINISHKSIRGKLLSYFSEQVLKNDSNKFEIPFNRQGLADYLLVDRSALSAELSKMKKDGILDYKKNKFHIYTK